MVFESKYKQEKSTPSSPPLEENVLSQCHQQRWDERCGCVRPGCISRAIPDSKVQSAGAGGAAHPCQNCTILGHILGKASTLRGGTHLRAARIGIFHTKQKTAVAGLGVGFLRRVARKRGVLKGVGTER